MKVPFLMREEGGVSMSLSTLIQVYREFEAGQMVEDTLLKADAQGVNVIVPKETVNFIKLALFASGSRNLSDRARGFIRSAGCAKSSKHYYQEEPH